MITPGHDPGFYARLARATSSQPLVHLPHCGRRSRSRPRAGARGWAPARPRRSSGSPNWTVTLGKRSRFQPRTAAEPWIATGTIGAPDSSAIRPIPGFGLPSSPRARAAALGVDQQHLALVEEREGGLEGLLVAVAAANREDAAVLVDVGEDRRAEDLRFGHEADLAPQVDAAEEVVHLAEVVGGENQRALARHVLQPDRPHPVDQDRRQRMRIAGDGVGPADAPSRRRVELVEVLRRARVLVDLWLHLRHARRRPRPPLVLPSAGVTRRRRPAGPAPRTLQRPAPAGEQRLALVLAIRGS